MSYTALYRKWRPQTFNDVRGQEAIVKTLQNQILSNRIGHAYLFCGTRGTGKTSIAKIFAKAVNCEHPVDGNPCGECASCKAIATGNSMNVIEIDAASNNGVDNIREIRENVAYSPTDAKYKVYIIDEVHMLSGGAFNALLKTLEEPPSYVIFILATTEVHKIPVTILSRCQRYDFKRIPVDVLYGRLNEIMEAEGITAEEKAVRYIARTADGGMRDAISLLDQCSAFFFGQDITYEKALDVLGAVDTSVFSIFLRDIVAQSIVDAFRLLDKITVQGRDLTQFVIDFTWYMRNLLLVKATKDASEIVDINAENMQALKEEAAGIPEQQLIRFIRVFSELSNEIKYSVQKRILIEIAVIKLCRPEMQQDYDSVLERIRVLEEKLESGDWARTSEGEKHTDSDSSKSDAAVREDEEALIEALPMATKEDLGKISSMWSGIIGELPEQYKAYLRMSIPSVRPTDGKLMIRVNDGTVCLLANSPFCLESIAQAIEKNLGKTVDFEVVATTQMKEQGVHYPSLEQFGGAVEVDDSEFDDDKLY